LQNDLTIIRLAAAGDQQAFEQLFRRHRQRLYRLAAGICGVLDADDVVQAVFLKLWQEPKTLRKIEKPSAWLSKATVNKAIDQLRSSSRKLAVVDAEQLEAVAGTSLLEAGELAGIFEIVASQLGARQRAAFVLVVVEGLKSKEAAELMAVTDSTVRNLVKQAKDHLRQKIASIYPEYSPAKE
jgi:RNA polymerase sigma-70 factor (ECF subfamily)